MAAEAAEAPRFAWTMCKTREDVVDALTSGSASAVMVVGVPLHGAFDDTPPELGVHANVEALSLGVCGLAWTDCRRLGEMLANHPGLAYLGVGGNHVGRRGVRLLLNALDRRRLEYLNVSFTDLDRLPGVVGRFSRLTPATCNVGVLHGPFDTPSSDEEGEAGQGDEGEADEYEYYSEDEDG